MLRAVLLTVFTFFAFVCQAQAVERPRLDVLGFSPDGRFFAFRQSGVEANGVAFADLFITDTTTDKWVDQTPLHVRYTPDQGDLKDARAALDAQSQRLLRRLNLSRASSGVTYVPRSRNQLSLDLPWGERVLMRLETRSGLAAPGCPVSMPVAKGSLLGFLLTLQRPDEVSVVHNDSIIPRGRGCPTGYRFASGFVKTRGSDAVVASMIAYREPTLRQGDYNVRYMSILTVIPKVPR